MLEALTRGWHVLCEKPLLLDLVEMENVCGFANGRGLAVIPVHNWKYAPIVRRATAALRSGIIGGLQRIEMETARALQQIRAEAVEFSVAIASKILQRNVSKEDNQRLIEETFRQIESTRPS